MRAPRGLPTVALLKTALGEVRSILAAYEQRLRTCEDRGLAAVYVALSAVFCWPLFAQPLANGSGDWDQHTLYYAAALRNAAFGDLPFWNPWYCGGNVLWANPQASLVSPVYLLALVMPITLAMK